MTADPFFVAEQLPHDELRPGTHRRTLKLGEVELLFISYTRPTVSSPHQHDHSGIIYIDEGTSRSPSATRPAGSARARPPLSRPVSCTA